MKKTLIITVSLLLVLGLGFACSCGVVEEETLSPEVAEEEEMPAPTTPEAPAPTEVPEIPIIDAHSQVCPENIDKVIQLMDQGGVACTILSSGMTSTIGIVTPEELVSFASNYPGRIIPAVRTKVKGSEDYYELLEKQMNMDGFGAMAEVLMYHGTEIPGRPIPLIVAHPTDKSVQTALKYALDKKWPFIVHIEFVTAGSQRDQFMTELKALLVQYPEHPFALIHMGQLDCAAVQELIEAHGNIYFITSSSTPSYAVSKFTDRWTIMFDGRNLSADWKQLIIQHPNRFILGFDMVWANMWGKHYLDTVAIWQEAIKGLPVEVAHAFAHGNAERLWRLPPVE